MEITRGNRCRAQKSYVLAMWEEFFALCDCVPLNTLAEAGEMFAAFETIDP